MNVLFEKYQGTGNDFVLLNNLNGAYNDLSIDAIQKICDRRFGVGADGLIKINSSEGFSFEMDYYNSDGSKSFCGNGARCAVAFAESLGLSVDNCTFSAIDGVHVASKKGEVITLNMLPVSFVNQIDSDFVLDTGSPHFVRLVADLDNENIVDVGKEIRYSESYKKEGINVNLVECVSENSIKIETYERGVEDETLSCGTGATASALIIAYKANTLGPSKIAVHVKGGELMVSYNYKGNGIFSDIQLIGPAKFVFKGAINV